MTPWEREDQNQIPCIIDEGIIMNRQDMVRVLRDLNRVRYTDVREETVRVSGVGTVTHVHSHERAATMVVNRRLYLNVNGFDFLRLSRGNNATARLELVNASRILQLEPLWEAEVSSIPDETAFSLPAEAWPDCSWPISIEEESAPGEDDNF
jgi:hypothetical protein